MGLSFANRYARHLAAPMIPESEIMPRVLASVRTMRAMPGVRMTASRSSWPREFDFHAIAIVEAVFSGETDNKMFRRLRYRDFEDVHFGKPASDDDDDANENLNAAERRFEPPSRAEVSDALIAGAWFARLALLAENIDEFEGRVAEFRSGKRRNPQVEDQEIVSFVAFGWSFYAIGKRLDVDGQQAENLYFSIARRLFDIANGRTKLADPIARQRARKLAQISDVSSRTAG